MDYENMISRISDRIIRWGLLFLIVFTPLAFGSVQRWAYETMEATVLFLILTWFWKMAWDGEIRIVKLSFFPLLGIFFLIVFFQLIPLPEELLSLISPATSDLYRWTMAGTDVQGAVQAPGEGFRSLSSPSTISVYPHATWTALLKLLSYIGAFFLVIHSVNSRKDVRFMIWALVLTGFSFSLFAMAQKFDGNGKAFWIFSTRQTPYGPYINKNHFAGYIEMIIPLAIGFYLTNRKMTIPSSSPRTWARAVLSWGEVQNARAILLIAMAAFMTAALFLSLSRGGMISFLVSMCVLAWCLKNKEFTGRWFPRFTLFLSISFIMVIWLGFEPIMERLATIFQVEEVEHHLARPRVWKDMLSIARDHPFWGSGLATFARIYPLYQSSDLGGRFTYAENDYLQLLVETGALGAIFALAAGALFGIHIWRHFMALRDERWFPLAAGGIASGAAIAVHSLVDFNLHIPANAFHFALIMGLTLVMVNLRGGERKQRITFEHRIIQVKGPRSLWGWGGAIIFLLALYGFHSGNYTIDQIHFERGRQKVEQMLEIRRLDPARAAELGREAIASLRTALSFNPLNHIYHVQLGWISHRLKLYAASVGEWPLLKTPDPLTSFQKAIRVDPSNAKLHQAIGKYFLKNWDLLSAEERDFGWRVYRKATSLRLKQSR